MSTKALRTLTRVATLDLEERKASTDGLKRYPATLSTETPVARRTGTGRAYDEVLSHASEAVDLSRTPLPLIESHDRSKVNVGIVENVRLDGGRLRGDLVLGKSQRARELAADIEAGIVTGISIGYLIETIEVSEGGDVHTATRWVPYEVSIVGIPADHNAGIGRSATMEGQDEVNPEGGQAAVTAERERVAGIRHAVKTGKLGDAFANRLIADNVSLADARHAVIEALADRSDAVTIDPHLPTEERNARGRFSVGETEREKMQRGMTAAILSRAGMLPMLAGVVASKPSMPGVRAAFKAFDADDDGGEYQSMTLAEMARETLERRGVRTRPMSRERMIGEALTRAGGQATASDFAIVLENTLHKVLMGAYAQASDSWRRFCGTDSVQDFRSANRYRTGSFGTLPVVAESAEFQNLSIPDGQKMQISTETRGGIVALSRQAIINDDMGALTETTGKFGRAAGLSIEKAVYDLLAQNAGLGPTITIGSTTQPLFDAAWGNIGTGAALSMASIEADRVKMASQKDISNNEFLDLRPRTLLVPLALEGEANVLNRAKFDPTAASAFERPNIVGGLFRDVVGTPRLTGTRRYLFSDQVHALVVVFLNGTQAPFMEQQLGWRVDGTEWKVRLDFKALAFDPKGAVTNAGA